MDDAKAVFDQAKSKGLQGDGFDQLEQRLGYQRETKAVEFKYSREPPSKQLQSLLIYIRKVSTRSKFLTQAAHLLEQYPNSIALTTLGCSKSEFRQF